MILIILAILFWIVCGFFSFGFSFSYLQNEYKTLAVEDYKTDYIMCVILSLFGPLNMIAIVILNMHKYGLKFK